MRFVTVIIVFLITASATVGQDGTSWHRGETEQAPPLQLFHSTHGINLPTAEVLQQGNVEFEVSHRFVPRVSDGSRHLWGFDGPSNIRLALGYAYSDDGYVTLGRSNVQDNLELTVKHQILRWRNETLPVLLAARVGAAWNSDVNDRDAGDARNVQYYAQLIFNTMYADRFALGVVPSYVDNSRITHRDRQYTFVVGLHAQYYVTDVFNVVAEWIPTVSGWRTRHNTVAFGIELETGGHFFKIIASNNELLNTAQLLAGATDSFDNGDLHIGFNITRLLMF
ncbi:MAG: DUF5777 family beta-barrel protein [Bacteroidota bacterium]|jgi:hypothetical protein|nr:DUF5777 family beta-barrel protein [Bacteroidota bacterium]